MGAAFRFFDIRAAATEKFAHWYYDAQGVSNNPPQPVALPLERVGPYQLVTELGRGALGPLFGARVATGGEEGRLVAVRRIPIASCGPDESKQMVEAARIARRVRHSKLAAVLDVVASNREIALIGEYVDGQTLSSLQRLAYSKRSPLPPAVALRIGVEILHGLRAARDAWKAVAPPSAHGAHGGISPDNVFVAAVGEVLLGEIGVSATASTVAPFQRLPGILAYRSPEQLRTDATDWIDERSDIFSVGVLLWELLANRPLFGDPERLQAAPDDGNPALVDRTLRDVQSKLIPPLASNERNGAPIARAAVAVVERALRRDPATRYAGLDQMLGALLALSRDVVASGDQVGAAVNPLARAEVDAQRAALGSLPSIRPPPPSGSARDSSRPTMRPNLPAPEARVADTTVSPSATVAEQFGAQQPPEEQFSQQEAPTYPTAQLPTSARELPANKPVDLPSATRSLPPLPKPVSTPSERAPSKPPPSSLVPPPPVLAKARAFSNPLPPLPEFPEPAAPPAVAAEAPPERYPDAGVDGLPTPAAHAAKDDPAPSRHRARRIALVVGGVMSFIGLLGLLRALLRPAPEGAPAATPRATEHVAPRVPGPEPTQRLRLIERR